MDRGAWRALVHRIAKNQTWLSDFHFLSHKKTPEIWFMALILLMTERHPCLNNTYILSILSSLLCTFCFTLWEFKWKFYLCTNFSVTKDLKQDFVFVIFIYLSKYETQTSYVHVQTHLTGSYEKKPCLAYKWSLRDQGITDVWLIND